MIKFKGSHFDQQVIVCGVRRYVAYPMRYRQLEEMMEERVVEVDDSTLNRRVIRYTPLLEQPFRAHKCPVGPGWRLDEIYVKVKGCWKYLYRAVDKAGATVNFLLTAKRDRKAALRFLRKAIGQHGVPEKITIDKSGAKTTQAAVGHAGYFCRRRNCVVVEQILEDGHCSFGAQRRGNHGEFWVRRKPSARKMTFPVRRTASGPPT
jgi:putative transposase